MFQQVNRRNALFTLAVASISVFGSACNGKSSLIDHVVFKPSDNLEVVKVSVVFTDKVKSEISGGIQIKDYGQLFVNSYTDTTPFEVGFNLNTAIVNDQDYVHLAPTTNYPNGLPMGLPYAVVEVHMDKPVSSKFDIYGYVDVLHGTWMGLATMFNFMNDSNFPDGLSVSQVFLRDAQGNPGVLASVFGPVVENGVLKRNGGISVFANIKQLLHHGLQPGKELVLYAEPGVTMSGPAAPKYENDGRALRRMEKNVIEGLNGRL